MFQNVEQIHLTALIIGAGLGSSTPSTTFLIRLRVLLRSITRVLSNLEGKGETFWGFGGGEGYLHSIILSI